MTTTTPDPHAQAQRDDAFSDAWAAVYIDVAEKLDAEDSQAQTGDTTPTDAEPKGDEPCPGTSPPNTTTET